MRMKPLCALALVELLPLSPAPGPRRVALLMIQVTVKKAGKTDRARETQVGFLKALLFLRAPQPPGLPVDGLPGLFGVL
jgi:hypothetical protein